MKTGICHDCKFKLGDFYLPNMLLICIHPSNIDFVGSDLNSHRTPRSVPARLLVVNENFGCNRFEQSA